jgi:dihydrofolate reductase
MLISMIVAMGSNRVIGQANQLPWQLPADLTYFKRTTMGKAVIMGRKTYETIGRPLPGRKNIILTRDESYQAGGCLVVHSVESALQAAGEGEVMIIGGGQIYPQFLPLAERIYMTHIDSAFEGDTFFPELGHDQWALIQRSQTKFDKQTEFAYTFVIYERRR